MKKLAIRNKYLSIYLAMVLTLLAVIPVNAVQPITAQAADMPNAPAVNENAATVTWDCIYFGNYTPVNGGTPEKIKWRVLSVDANGKAFLLANQNVEVKQYKDNNYEQNITWDQSYLKEWLNGITDESQSWKPTYNNNFLKKAFTDEERIAIQADANQDKISVLSLNDLKKSEYGFVSGYTSAQSARTSQNMAQVKTAYPDSMDAWWVKGTASGTDHYYIGADGAICQGKTNDSNIAVRPVLYLDLTKDVWEKADPVSVELGDKLDQTIPKNPSLSQSEEGNTVKWDCVYFGNYYKSNGTDKEPIKWRVLSVNGNDAMLLADQSIDAMSYNDSVSEKMKWDRSTLHRWLNGAEYSWQSYYTDNFVNNAFSIEEKDAIILQEVPATDDNGNQKVDKDHNDAPVFVHDRVGLLTSDDVDKSEYGFYTNTEYKSGLKSIACESTSYAKSKYSVNAWWLEDGVASDVYYVDAGGFVAQQPMNINNAVRPVIHLDLTSAVWSRAEDVTVNIGEATENDKDILKDPTVTQGTETTKAVAAWDRIYFGSYWQSDTNGDGVADENDDKEPIKWRILSLDGDIATLISDQILDSQQFNGHYNYSNVWGESPLRTWLNGTFYNAAFTKAEKSAIQMETVVTDGAATQDNLWFLSLEEATDTKYGFREEFNLKCPTRVATNTDYTAAKNELNIKAEKGGDWWWLRDKGEDDKRVACVWGSGHGEYRGIDPNWECGIRPVLRLDLSKHVWMNEPEDEKMQPVEIEAEELPDQLFPTPKPGETADPNATPQPTEDPVNHGLHNPQIVDGVTTWDCIYFGNYYQESETEKEPIKWRVLSVSGDSAFLLADKNLDSRPFNDEWTGVKWKDSSLCEWLNKDFLKAAFTPTEQAAIPETQISSTAEGITVKSQLYLLTVNEAKNEKYGFSSDPKEENKARVALNTSHVHKSNSAMRPLNNADWYWLRTSGDNAYRAAHVGSEGNIYEDGSSVNDDYYAVRPVLHLDLSRSVWKKAGSVDSSLSEMVKTSISTVKKQTKVTDDAGNTYTVTKASAKKGQVAYTAPKSQSVSSVVIPSAVTIKGVQYQVTSVKSNAFKNCKKLKKVTVGKNVRKIGTKAFYGCTGLKKMTLKTTKLTSKTVGKQSFAKMNSQTKIAVPKKKNKAYQTILRKKGVTGKKQTIK